MKWIKRTIWFLIFVSLGYAVWYAWRSFPVMSGYVAKNMCSCVFVAGRDELSVEKEELGDAPLKYVGYQINRKDSSVIASVLGLAKKKAVFRKGLGCVLVNTISESELKKQSFNITANKTLNGEWQNDTLPTSYNNDNKYNQLRKLINNITATKNAKGRHETRAIIVMYNGFSIARSFAPGFNENSRMLGWSMAKSVTAALVGMLVKQRKLKLDAPAPVPEWSDTEDTRHAITLQHLLQQTSGLNFEENYKKRSDATSMLFTKDDMAAYAASRPLLNKPGERFYYSSGNSNIISRIVRHTVGENNYLPFVYDSFFNKIGMYSALMEPDASGTLVGSSYVWATANDWAKFGLLYYNHGIHHDYSGCGDGCKMFFLPEWTKATATSSSADTLQHYGYQFWLNGKNPTDTTKRIFADVPADMFYADGYAGQYVIIIPSKKMLIVRLGYKDTDINALLKQIFAAMPDP